MINFARVVEQVFAKQKIKWKEDIQVVIEYDGFSLLLTYDEMRYEIVTTLIVNKLKSYPLADVLSLFCDEREIPRFLFMMDDEVAYNYLSSFAHLLEREQKAIKIRKEEIISEFIKRDLEDKRNAMYGISRKKAEEAWEKKDYAEVVRCYNEIIHDLTLIEQKKMQIAKKNL